MVAVVLQSYLSVTQTVICMGAGSCKGTLYGVQSRTIAANASSAFVCGVQHHDGHFAPYLQDSHRNPAEEVKQNLIYQ